MVPVFYGTILCVSYNHNVAEFFKGDRKEVKINYSMIIILSAKKCLFFFINIMNNIYDKML